jgi:HSP20 family molecular chaperone IbpA
MAAPCILPIDPATPLSEIIRVAPPAEPCGVWIAGPGAREPMARAERLLQRELSRCLLISFAPGSEWRPNTDVFETAAELVVRVDLAGMREEGVEITLYDDILLVAGRREPHEGGATPQRFYEATIPYGRFQAEITLPFPVNCEQVTAHYDRGLLEVTLPKLPVAGEGEGRGR